MDSPERVKSLLDQHLAPLIPEEWKSHLSIYEAGAVPDENGEVRLVIAWLRSFDLETHCAGLAKHLKVDRAIRNGSDGSPRVLDSTVIVRFKKELDFGGEKPIEFLVEIFSVCEDESMAESIVEKIQCS